MESLEELNKRISDQGLEFKGERQKLYSLFLSDFVQKRNKLSPNATDPNLIHCRWCGKEFTPKSHNSQTCDAQYCVSTRRRYHKLKKQLNSYPIILQAYEKEADEITTAAQEGFIAISTLWRELFYTTREAIVYVQKSKRG